MLARLDGIVVRSVRYYWLLGNSEGLLLTGLGGMPTGFLQRPVPCKFDVDLAFIGYYFRAKILRVLAYASKDELH